jgi:Zn-finger nucleic acid-binding protein
MNCPFDGTDLKVVNRQGIEIDWCPSCKGVWLERGELDKLLERSEGRDDDDDDDDDRYDARRRGAPMPPPGYQPAPGYPPPGYQQPGHQQPYPQPDYDRQGYPYKKKKKSFLRDMLEFD